MAQRSLGAAEPNPCGYPPALYGSSKPVTGFYLGELSWKFVWMAQLKAYPVKISPETW